MARGVVWIAMFYPATMALSYAMTRRLSGRDWRALTTGQVAIAVLAIAIVTTTVSQMAGDEVIAYVSPALYWGVTATALSGRFVLLVKRNNPVRFPAHAAHLQRLRRGPLAGRPPHAQL